MCDGSYGATAGLTLRDKKSLADFPKRLFFSGELIEFRFSICNYMSRHGISGVLSVVTRQDATDRFYTLLMEDEDARVCRDIPEAACDEQPAAFTRQLLAQTLTKIGDALTSSRLVMAWILSSIGGLAGLLLLLLTCLFAASFLPFPQAG